MNICRVCSKILSSNVFRRKICLYVLCSGNWKRAQITAHFWYLHVLFSIGQVGVENTFWNFCHALSTEIRHSHGWIFHKQHLQHLSNFLLDDFCGSWKKGSLAAPRTCPLGNCDPKKIVGYLDSCMHIRFCIWFGSCGRLYKFCPPTVVRPLPHFVAVSQNFRKTSNG